MRAIVQYFRYHILIRKLKTKTGALLLCLVAMLFALVMNLGHWLYGTVVVAVLAEIILVLLAVSFPLISFYITAFISTFIFFPERFLGVHLPTSVGVEFLILGVYVGILLRNRFNKDNSHGFYRAPYTLALFAFFLFQMIEVFNPNMYSVLGWSMHMRRFLDFLIVYYIGFQLFDDLPKIRFFIKFWVALGVLIAAYACKQQWLGLSWFELNWLYDNPHLVKLYLQGGQFRKFSFLSDPAATGVLMASMSIFTLVLGLGQDSRRKKWILISCSFLMILAMQYTGTRTATAVTVGGILFYILMTINQVKTFYFAILSGVLFAFLFFAPIDNGTVNRFRSSFRPNEGSLEVRNINRKMIQPYIYKHPLGGGLYTSGYDGYLYNPGHPLANFPPDSGMLKLAIETGWVGLAVALVSFLGLIFQGVHYYFKAQNKEIRLYILALVTGVFIFVIAQYAQIAIGQFPGLLFFYPSSAILIRLLQIDNKMNAENDKKQLIA